MVLILQIKKERSQSLRDGLVVKSTRWSSKGPGVDSQNSHGGSQLPRTPILGINNQFQIPMGTRCIWCTAIQTGKKLIHITYFNLKKKTTSRLDDKPGCKYLCPQEKCLTIKARHCFRMNRDIPSKCNWEKTWISILRVDTADFIANR